MTSRCSLGLFGKTSASSIELLETTFEPQEYAFAVPINSPLRKSVGVAILAAIHSDWWEQTTVALSRRTVNALDHVGIHPSIHEPDESNSDAKHSDQDVRPT